MSHKKLSTWENISCGLKNSCNNTADEEDQMPDVDTSFYIAILGIIIVFLLSFVCAIKLGKPEVKAYCLKIAIAARMLVGLALLTFFIPCLPCLFVGFFLPWNLLPLYWCLAAIFGSCFGWWWFNHVRYLFRADTRNVRFLQLCDAGRFLPLPALSRGQVLTPQKTHVKRAGKKKIRWGQAIFWLQGVVGVIFLVMGRIPLIGLIFSPIAGSMIRKAQAEIDDREILIKRLEMASLEELRQADPRPPIVLLRSFQDDLMEMKKDLSEKEEETTTFEEILCEYFAGWGPVVAIGDPKETLPPLGAARAYFSHETWQKFALQILQESRMVLMILGLTPSVRWELNHLLTSNHVSKTIIVLPPVKEVHYQSRIKLLQSVISEVRGEPWSPEVPKADHILAVAFDDLGRPIPVASSFTGELCYKEAVLLASKVVASHVRPGPPPLPSTLT